MNNENLRRSPNYPGLAQIAQQELKDKWNYSGVEGIHHINPVTKEECKGVMAISFSSWDEALRSAAMSLNGGIGGICIKCGGGSFINSNKQILEF